MTAQKQRQSVAAVVLGLLLLAMAGGAWVVVRLFSSTNQGQIVLTSSGAGGAAPTAPARPAPPAPAAGLAGWAKGLFAPTAQAPTSRPSGTMDLLVVDDATGKVLVGMTVQSGYGKQRTRGMTGTDGHLFVPLPAADFTVFNVSVRGRKYVPKRLWIQHGTEIPVRYTMKVEKGTTIGGKVVDEGGEPIANATVQVSLDKNYDTPNEYYDGNGAQGYRPIQTAADGTWTETAVPVDCDRMMIAVIAPGYTSGKQGLQEYSPHSQLYDRTAVFTLKTALTTAPTTTPTGP